MNSHRSSGLRTLRRMLHWLVMLVALVPPSCARRPTDGPPTESDLPAGEQAEERAALEREAAQGTNVR